MDDGFAVQTDAVARLAGDVLDGAILLGTAAIRLAAGATVAAGAFGNLPSSAAVGAAAIDALEDGSRAGDRLTSVLEGDVERLYQCAFAYQEAEESAEHSFGGAGGW